MPNTIDTEIKKKKLELIEKQSRLADIQMDLAFRQIQVTERIERREEIQTTPPMTISGAEEE